MQALNKVKLPRNWNAAIPTGFESFDEILGNAGGVFGARVGKTHLLSAQSGTGKTRLCLSFGLAMTMVDPEAFYCHYTGEQSVNALVSMGKAMGVKFTDNMMADTEVYWPAIAEQMLKLRKENKNSRIVLVIDSIPMITFPLEMPFRKPMDTKSRIKMIEEFADHNDICVILLNHTDKQGKRAGRNELLHLCDVSYTLRVVNDPGRYDGIKVVEFHPEKNREGAPVERAFPFNGTWDLSSPFPLHESGGNESGGANNGKVAERKTRQRETLMDIIADMGGKLTRKEIEEDQVEIQGLAKSGIYGLLRVLVEEKALTAKRAKAGGKGAPPIIEWSTVESA